MFYIMKKELTAFPFDKFYEFVNDRIQEGIKSLERDARVLHEKDITRRIERIYASREDSYEGNPEDDFPFPGIDPSIRAKEIDSLRRNSSSLFLEKYSVKSNASWLLPQFTAHIARLPIAKDETGKYSPQSLKDALDIDTFHKGLWLLGTHHSRGEIVSKQYTSESRNYSALVPLLLMPFKKFDNIQYSDWSLEGLQKVVDPSLYQAMTIEFDISEIPIEKLLEAREIGLKIKSGKNDGGMRNPLTTHKLYGLPYPFSQLSWLAQDMLFQVWCAHPNNRTELMILDWKNWDKMPEPLIIKDPISTPKFNSNNSLSWDE